MTGPGSTAPTGELADPDVDLSAFTAPPTRRSFSAGDVIRLLVGVSLILVGGVIADSAQSTIRGIERDLLSVFSRLPDRFEDFILSAAQLVTGWVPTVAIVLLLLRRRWKVALLLILAMFLAVVFMLVGDAVVIDRDLEELLEEASRGDSMVGNDADSVVLAATTALVTVAAPWLSRRWKRVLWSSVIALVFLRIVAVSQPAFDLVLALGIGTAVGSLILLLFGSPTTEPGPEELVAGLRRVNLDPRSVTRAQQVDSVVRYRVTDGEGRELDVTLRTPDERDAELLNRLYRGLRFRASEVDTAYATLKRRVEHEALVLAVAERSGVPAPRLVRIGTTERGSAFLVTDAVGARPVEDDDLSSPAFRASLWRDVGELHDAGVAHRSLSLESIRVDRDGQPLLTGFDRAQTAPERREMARDVAELLTETAVVVGPRAAVEAAVDTLGPERVAESMRMLQPLALGPGARGRAKQVPDLLDDLREQVNLATGEPGIQLEEIERIKPRTVLVVGASALAFYTLLPQLANLEDTIDAFGDANLGWIGGALLFSALTYFFAAISFQGAVADSIPFAPNVRAQVASSFAGLVGPAGAGGFALTARFLQRVGVGSAEAGASVAVNAVGGFAVHLSLLLGFVVWSGRSGVGGFSLPDSSTVLLVLTIVLVVIGVLLAIGPVRRRVVAPALSAARSGAAQIGQVFRSPSRVLALFGGSAGISLAYVAAVACSVEAFGGGLSFPQIGAGYLAAVALATLAPTPGGLGALESAMIAAFTGFGLADSAAVSATLTFRLATFWLPILPGWLVFGWMQRNEEL